MLCKIILKQLTRILDSDAMGGSIINFPDWGNFVDGRCESYSGIFSEVLICVLKMFDVS